MKILPTTVMLLLAACNQTGTPAVEAIVKGRWAATQEDCASDFTIFSKSQIELHRSGQHVDYIPVKKISEFDSRSDMVEFVISVSEGVARKSTYEGNTTDIMMVYKSHGDSMELVKEGTRDNLLDADKSDAKSKILTLERCRS